MAEKDIFEDLKEIARLARTGDYGNAASASNRALARIQSILTQVKPDQKALAPLLYSLETMLMMQQQKDWVAFADVIEYEFLSLLQKTIAAKR